MVTSQQKQQCESQYYYVGAIIDEQYELTRFIGAGGMACVYLAKEIGSPHQFALKFLKDAYHNESYLVEYFEDEASSMRNLSHPNIVRFYRFVNRENYSYIVMDYVEGFSLSEVLKLAHSKNERLPLDEVIRVMTQVARALDAIHRDSFVHRDVKPSNILIERETGRTFITDLGITSAQNTRMVGAGTIAYMSPEQAETWVADQRADIYAYGTMLYELLTGERPFNVQAGLRGSEAEADLLRKHKEAPVPHVTNARQDLPKELNKMIAKSLAKNPDARYQSVIEFAQDVHQVLIPKLDDDLNDFASIQPRYIAPPTTVTEDNSQGMFRALLAVGIIAIVVAGLIAFSAIFDLGSLVTDSATETASPTATNTVIPTLTPTPNPIANVEAGFALLNGIDALSEPDADGSLLIRSNEDEVFNYLRIGAVDGFQVLIDINSSDNVSLYGLAFRMQDTQNYYYFALNPTTLIWEIIDVIEGIETVQASGELSALPTELSISGLGNFFEIRSGESVISYESDLYARGSLALYLVDGELLLDDIQVNLLGEDATIANTQAPTPSIGLADPLRFLRADISALLATNLPLETAINCPDYITVYDSLERHTDSDNPEIVAIAEDALTTGFIVYQRCLIESPDDILSFNEFVQEYSEWETNLNRIQSDLDE